MNPASAPSQGAPRPADERGPTASVTALGARVHLFVRPDARDSFTAVFRDVLGCQVVERDFGLPYPVLVVSLPDGSRFSVEFTDLAPREADPATLDDSTAHRGAWLEFRTTDVDHFQQRLIRAGVPHFHHPGSPHRYFSAPGGQVFRLIDVDYDGP